MLFFVVFSRNPRGVKGTKENEVRESHHQNFARVGWSGWFFSWWEMDKGCPDNNHGALAGAFLSKAWVGEVLWFSCFFSCKWHTRSQCHDEKFLWTRLVVGQGKQKYNFKCWQSLFASIFPTGRPQLSFEEKLFPHNPETSYDVPCPENHSVAGGCLRIFVESVIRVLRYGWRFHRAHCKN